MIAYRQDRVARDRWTLSLQCTVLDTVDPELMIVNPMASSSRICAGTARW